MKLILIIPLLFLSYFHTKNKENQNSWPWNALLKVNQTKIPIYNNFNKDRVLYYIMNDTIKEEYFLINLIKKKKNFFQVKTASSFTEDKIREGWIQVKYIGIYLRPRGSSDIYPIYDEPNEKSKYHNVINKSNELIDVIDVCGDWLKIKMKINNIIETGWMSSKFLCSNPYSTCN
ncbi:MAG: hypothetical protein ACYCOO_12225 [Chitinophagaceae bacterium]